MDDMDRALINRLNELWKPIYPYLARWIGQWLPREPAWILELGPFSGGISWSMRGSYGRVGMACVMPQYGIAEAVRPQFGPDMQTLVGHLERLPFKGPFDMVLFRGAFFFLTPKIIEEVYRILKPRGYAVLGGGYGPLTPPEEIAKIAEESKRLNYQLGKRWVSRKALEGMVREAGTERGSRILDEGGLWLLLKKEFP